MFPRENNSFCRAGVTQLVECDLAKVDVAGSNPVSRSKFRPPGTDMNIGILMNMRSAHLILLPVLTAFSAIAQDYKLEPIATAAPGLPASYAAAIQPQGYRVSGAAGPWCEVWL